MTDRKSKAPGPQGPDAVRALDVPPPAAGSAYPEPFRARMDGREKRKLGDVFGLANFGVNLTRLAPGGESALMHRHSRQDEFIYVLEGRPTLVTETGETVLAPGMCAGFPAGGGAHQLVNRSDADAVFLEIGDRTAGDAVVYPQDDLQAAMVDGKWVFTRKDGSAY